MGFRIRSGQIADAAVLGRVHAQAWQETYKGMMPASILASKGTAESRTVRWNKLFAATAGQGSFLVEDAQGEIVGFGDCGPSLEVTEFAPAEVNTLYLLRCAQGCGLGRSLLKQMFDYLSGRDFTKVGLKTHADNSSANQFYLHLGGQKAGEIKNPDWNETVYVWPDITRFIKGANLS